MMTARKVGESRRTNRGNAGRGRVKGVPNKVTGALKDMILGALDAAGGQHYLTQQAHAHPGAFFTLLGKVLPLQVTGNDEGPIKTLSVDLPIDPIDAARVYMEMMRGDA